MLDETTIATLNLTQARAESKAHYDAAAAIEKKYTGAENPLSSEDENEIKRLLGTIDKLEEHLGKLEPREAQRKRILENVDHYNSAAGGSRHQHAAGYDPERERSMKSPGQEFVESGEYKAVLQSGRLNNPAFKVEFAVPVDGSLLQKALIYSASGSGGGAVFPQFLPGVSVPALFRELTVLDLISRGSTESNLIEYVQETTPATNSAATVAESTATTGTSGTKAEGTIAYTLQTVPVRTIAWWVPITNRMLADAPMLRAVIDNRLLLGLNLTLESQVITGDGTGENFTGIVNATGINVTGIGAGLNRLDAIFQGMTQVRVTGLSRPTGTVLHPLDFQTIRLTRESLATATQGGYLMGPPSLQGAVTLWGLPIVQSLGVAAGTGIVGDFAMGCMLFDREEASVRTGYINDQFTRNMQTLLAELRAAFVVWRGAAFSKITGM